MTRTEIVARTLLHFLWQGALIRALLVLLLRVARHSDANVRYAMGVAAIALMAVSPVITATKFSTSGETSAGLPAAPSADPIAEKVFGALVRLDNGPAQQTEQGTVLVARAPCTHAPQRRR